jgi:carboxypeptidase T
MLQFRKGLLAAAALLSGYAIGVQAQASESSVEESVPTQVIEVKASTREQRSRLADLGFSLDEFRTGKVYIYGHDGDLQKIRAAGFEAQAYAMKPEWLKWTSPYGEQAGQEELGGGVVNRKGRATHGKASADQMYHSYDETLQRLEALATQNPAIASITSLGKSYEGRDMKMIRISGKTLAQAEQDQLPVAFYMGCHHAREHLSVEVPTLFAEYLVNNYDTNPDVKRLVDSREIYVAPIINPDGFVYDYHGQSGGRMWRKNRRPNGDGTYGTDLNRNYGYEWDTGGASDSTNSEVYAGPKAFSEIETQNVKAFIDSQPRMTVLLTLHTFSELVLYPWGYTYKKVGDTDGKAEDHAIFEKMATTMAGWNHYTPEQSSALYIASGDTTDWAYATHGIFAFTFEMTPTSMFGGGFYPEPTVIKPTFDANLKPMMYMLEYADNPRRVLTESNPPNFLVSAARRGIPMADFNDIRL